MHLFEDLARQGKLLCPKSRQPVQVRDGRIVSAAGRDFGDVAGPLNFLANYRDNPDTARVSPADVERMRAQLQLPSTPEVTAGIARAIAATASKFDKAHLSAEAKILASRFRMDAFALDTESAPSLAQRIASAASNLVRPREARLKHLSNSVGALLTAGQQVYRSVRVRNAGKSVLEAAGSRIETRFESLAGELVVGTETTSAVPVDIAPGRAITLVVALRAPADVGKFRLAARQLAPGGAGRDFLGLGVEVIACELPVFEFTYFPDSLDYSADHHTAMLELVAFLEQRHPQRPMSLLEIGGGVHPTGHALAQRGHRVISSDISHSQSILGTLYFHDKMPALDESLGFISCEGTQLPFAPGSFDGVMMLAAFHHFADPVRLLREAARIAGPGGFIYMGCDSCAPDPTDPQYLEDLRSGVNEQMWTLAELTAFYHEAGLAVARARVDGSSLKVALVPLA